MYSNFIRRRLAADPAPPADLAYFEQRSTSMERASLGTRSQQQIEFDEPHK